MHAINYFNLALTHQLTHQFNRPICASNDFSLFSYWNSYFIEFMHVWHCTSMSLSKLWHVLVVFLCATAYMI